MEEEGDVGFKDEEFVIHDSPRAKDEGKTGHEMRLVEGDLS